MSFWELVVILLVGLIVIKPERLPEMAYLLGRFISQIRFWYHECLQKLRQY